jgi:hypothetical protein
LVEFSEVFVFQDLLHRGSNTGGKFQDFVDQSVETLILARDKLNFVDQGFGLEHLNRFL